MVLMQLLLQSVPRSLTVTLHCGSQQQCQWQSLWQDSTPVHCVAPYWCTYKCLLKADILRILTRVAVSKADINKVVCLTVLQLGSMGPYTGPYLQSVLASQLHVQYSLNILSDSQQILLDFIDQTRLILSMSSLRCVNSMRISSITLNFVILCYSMLTEHHSL